MSIRSSAMLEFFHLEMDFPPPEGSVPLYALGRVPLVRQGSIMNDPDTAITRIGEEEPRFPNSPYIGRLRSKVPPLAQMKEIDRANRVAFGFPKGEVAYLMPVATSYYGAHAVNGKTQSSKSHNQYFMYYYG